MTQRRRLTLSELLLIMGVCLFAVSFAVLVLDQLHEVSLELEAAARGNAGVAWEDRP